MGEAGLLSERFLVCDVNFFFEARGYISRVGGSLKDGRTM